jgi:hypothetical protein
VQPVNTSANRLHCQSAPSAALVGDVRLTDSNATTQANITYAAISTAALWVLGWEIMPWLPYDGWKNEGLVHSPCDLIYILTHISRWWPEGVRDCWHWISAAAGLAHRS